MSAFTRPRRRRFSKSPRVPGQLQGHLMIELNPAVTKALGPPVSPLLRSVATQQNASNGYAGQALTAKITRSPPLVDLWWGDRVQKGFPVSSEAKHLQTCISLQFCRSTEASPSACVMHYEWGNILRHQVDDPRSAFAFYQFGCKAGHLPSMYACAMMLLHGVGTFCDPRRAKSLFDLISKAGCDHIVVTYHRCMCINSVPSIGKRPSIDVIKGVIREMEESVEKGEDYHCRNNEWCQVFALEPHQITDAISLAHMKLGSMYLHARFLGLDLGLALKHLVKAARMGNVEATCLLGDVYTFGMSGADQDRELARKFYTVAAAKGNKKAKRHLAQLD